MRVVVVDDQTVVREGLVTLLGTMPGIEVVGSASDGEEAVDLVAEVSPEVVLMDLRMPRLDGVEATRRIRADHPGTQVVVLTTYADDESIVGALRAGAIGYITKDAGRDHISRALEAAASAKPCLTRWSRPDSWTWRPCPGRGSGWPPSGRADPAGGRGPPPDRRGAHKRRDREGPFRQRIHRQDPCESHLRKDGKQGPVPGSRLRTPAWSRRLMVRFVVRTGACHRSAGRGQLAPASTPGRYRLRAGDRGYILPNTVIRTSPSPTCHDEIERLPARGP